jgi:4-hydroxyacetophenone monooxygenase
MTTAFGDSAEAIREHVNSLGVPLLVASLIHLTGDLSILQRAPRVLPPAYPGDASGSVSQVDAAEVRAEAITAIEGFRARNYPVPYLPSRSELQQILSYTMGAAVEDEYLELLSEELALTGDCRLPAWQRTPAERNRASMSVIIIGAGMSGLLLAHRLKQLGIRHSIIEKNKEVGGTWHENRYPGCRVDVPSNSYSYSFRPQYRWPNLYSPQAELQRYFKSFSEESGVRENIKFETEVTRLEYDEDQCDWRVTVVHDGHERTLRARAVVSAVGQLNRPHIPRIAGAEQFSGNQFHSARWPHELDLKDRRVAVIGSAATAVQLVPELAKIAKTLYVFQRTPNWIIVHPEYHRTVTRSEAWAQEHLPYFSRWQRVLLFNPLLDRSPDHLKIDPSWPQDGRSISKSNEAMRVAFTAGIRSALEDRPDLIEKALPTYPPFTKRPALGDGGYYRALLRPHVHLIGEPIHKITETAIVDGSDRHYDVDAIVYATGFRSMQFLAPMRVMGLGGRDLQDYWGDEPRAYLGMTVAGFPNLFCMYGPGTNLGYTGNLIFNSECQARYITGCLLHMVDHGFRAINVREDVYKRYAQRLESALESFSWSHPSTGNWYRNAAGKVITNSPWRLLDYWQWTRSPDFTDFSMLRADS